LYSDRRATFQIVRRRWPRRLLARDFPHVCVCVGSWPPKNKRWGDFYRAHDTNLKATLRRSVRASEGETHPGALLTSQPANLSRTYALPASTTAMESNPKNRPRRTAVRDKPIRLATCLDRSRAASGAIALTLLLGHARRQALAAGRSSNRCPSQCRGFGRR
jgi:hypothetical protein